MTSYILDTDIYIYLMAGDRAILEKIYQAGDESIYLSAITIAELYFGVFNSVHLDKNKTALQKHLSKLQILNFDQAAAEVFGRLKADLKKTGKIIADMDLAIASIAIRSDKVLVTHNQKHFARLTELKLEDWKDLPH